MAELDNVAFTGCLPGGEPVDLTDVLDKLCRLVDLLIATDPDMDGILNIEGEVEVSLAGQCLTVTNCDGETLSVELTAENIDDLSSSVSTSLADTCLQFKQCAGEVFEVTITPGDDPLPVEQDCTISIIPVVGCLDGECVEGLQAVEFTKSTGAMVVLSNDLPAGATVGACPDIITICAPVPCCDKRKVAPVGTSLLTDILGLGTGDTISSVTVSMIQAVDKNTPAEVTDCDGDPSPIYCGQAFSFEGGCADYTKPIESITTAAGDVVIVEARVCPAREATSL